MEKGDAPSLALPPDEPPASCLTPPSTPERRYHRVRREERVEEAGRESLR